MAEHERKYPGKYDRVIYMEELCDRIREAIDAEEFDVESLVKLRDDIKELEAYYESSAWREDFYADKRGEFPMDLKRGILAEDTLYDLFCDVDRILEE